MQTPPLIRAVQSGHMPLIGQLIRGGTEVNAIDAWGRTATHYAVSRNNQEALKLLLNNGADDNLADNDGNTPLDMWHKHNNEEMLVLLHETGAKPSFTKIEEEKPVLSPTTDTAPSPKDKVKSQDLWQAAANNDRASVERLLDEGADAKAKNADGKVPFEIAVEAEHAAVAAILLRAAAGVNGEDKKRWKPLHWAIVADEWDLVKAFIEEGADLNAGRHQSVLDIAKEMKREAKLMEAFISVKGVDAIFDMHRTALMWAVRNGHTEIVKLLVEGGADLDSEDWIGTTALMYAVATEQRGMVKYLIDNGANPNYKNSYGDTALGIAERNGYQEIIDILRAAQQGSI